MGIKRDVVNANQKSATCLKTNARQKAIVRLNVAIRIIVEKPAAVKITMCLIVIIGRSCQKNDSKKAANFVLLSIPEVPDEKQQRSCDAKPEADLSRDLVLRRRFHALSVYSANIRRPGFGHIERARLLEKADLDVELVQDGLKKSLRTMTFRCLRESAPSVRSVTSRSCGIGRA